MPNSYPPVIFAKAYEEKARPTHVAERMPSLTDHQVEQMTRELDIHGDGQNDAEKNMAGRGFGDSQPTTRANSFSEEVREDALPSHMPNVRGADA